MADRPSATPAPPAVEWPTAGLLAVTFAGWLALTAAYARGGGLWVLVPLVPLLVLHSSLQHEIVHGHPTRWETLNRRLGLVPLSLWLPFERYRVTHLQHHRHEYLTDPFEDPESRYGTAERWATLSSLGRLLVRAQGTLAGWVVLGSFLRMGTFLAGEARALWTGEPAVRAAWVEHALWVVPVLGWLVAVDFPLGLYVVAAVIPANGLLLVRSYAEHRAAPLAHQRTATVESSAILGRLFLNNHLHALHHADPRLPWYRLREAYRHRGETLRALGGPVYRSYGELARRYAWHAHDRWPHPTVRGVGRADRPG